RTWLKIGGLSLGALVSGLEPNLAGLFAAEGGATKRGRALSKDFSVILFWANGGPSHLDLFDLKPEAPAEIRGPFQPIRPNGAGLPRQGVRAVHAHPEPRLVHRQQHLRPGATVPDGREPLEPGALGGGDGHAASPTGIAPDAR